MRRARGMRISAQAHEHAVRDAVRAVQVILGASPHHDQAERMHGVRDAVRAVQVMLGASPHHDQAEQMHDVRDALRAVQVMLGASSIPCFAHPREHAVRMLAAIARHAVHETLGATRPCAERIHGTHCTCAVNLMLGACQALRRADSRRTCEALREARREVDARRMPGLAPSGFKARAAPSLRPPIPHPAIASLCPLFIPFALHSLTSPSPLSAFCSFALPCHSPSLPSPLCALPSFPLPSIPSPRHPLSLPSMPFLCPAIPPLCHPLSVPSFPSLCLPFPHPTISSQCPPFPPVGLHSLTRSAPPRETPCSWSCIPSPHSPPLPHNTNPCPTLSLSAPPSFFVKGYASGDQISGIIAFIEWYTYCARVTEHTEESSHQVKLMASRMLRGLEVFTQKSNWNIIKVHLVSQYIDAIRRAGLPEHWCAQLFEHLHIEYVKNPYGASNKRNAAAQVMNVEVNRLRLQALAPQLGKRKRYDTTMLQVSSSYFLNLRNC
ncbi:unnamed protein product [Closterium sp. NIES-53]